MQVDPKNDTVWFTWTAMEEDLGFSERAQELRIRQAEKAWEFEVGEGGQRWKRVGRGRSRPGRVGQEGMGGWVESKCRRDREEGV